MEPWLREILRCPACRSPLRNAPGPDGQEELACTGCSLAYRLDDGIPVLLVDEARDRDASASGRDATAEPDSAESGPAENGQDGPEPED
jgi:uncharacterized protein YbaR (Trm112 family)